MHSSSKRRSVSNPVRISTVERDLTRNDQRKTQTLKSKTCESSHIPRPRFRASSSDRAGSLGRKSYLKTGRTPLRQVITPISARLSTKLNVAGIASSSKSQLTLSTGRSPSSERIGAKGTRKDTRPLMDKTYQIDLLIKIDEFFYVNQCSSMLNNNGSLKPVALKMFVEVSSFLLNYFNINHDLTMTNYIDELPKYAKKLHYPGMMNKSWLKTANTMHSWPYVLGWIGWLVEACKVKEISFEKYQLETLPFIGTEQQAQSFSMEFQALLECYKAWNDEKHDEVEKLVEQYLKNIVIQQGVTEEDMNQAYKELEEEEEKLRRYEEESQKFDKKIEDLQHQLSCLHAKDSQQLNNIKIMKERINKLSNEMNQLNTECEILNEQIRIGNTQYAELSLTVKNQSMSKIEKENILKKCMEIQNYIHQFDEHLKDYEKEIYSLDIKLATSNNDLNKAILAYNKRVFMHIDNDFGLNFDELKLPEKGLLSVQITEEMERIASLIEIFKEKLMKQCNDMDSFLQSDVIKLEKLQEEVKSLPDENILKEEMSLINEIKANIKREKAKITKQIEDVKNEIKEMQAMMPDMQVIDLEIEEAQDKLDAVTRRKAFLEQAAKRFFEELYEIIGEHKQELHDILTKDRTK